MKVRQSFFAGMKKIPCASLAIIFLLCYDKNSYQN